MSKKKEKTDLEKLKEVLTDIGCKFNEMQSPSLRSIYIELTDGQLETNFQFTIDGKFYAHWVTSEE
jgi:hypothetical protein